MLLIKIAGRPLGYETHVGQNIPAFDFWGTEPLEYIQADGHERGHVMILFPDWVPIRNQVVQWSGDIALTILLNWNQTDWANR